MGSDSTGLEEAEKRAKEAEDAIKVLKVHLQFLQKIAGIRENIL